MPRSAEKYARITTALGRWFDGHARDLPWRRRRDGYTALVAEAMLQQTQVARVLERYDGFLARFPTIEALARADEQEVLACWQGLGYYRRARHLHAAAKTVVDEFAGRMPDDATQLRRLPGVGRYTAGSIASIVFGKAEPIVDGNVHRVLARLNAYRAPLSDPDAVNWAWKKARELVEATDRPGVVNEALMELGATICTPRSPKCGQCPLASHCQSKRKGLQDRIPAPKTAAIQREVHHHAVVIRRGAMILFEQRPSGGMWSMMWQAPTLEAGRRVRRASLETSLPVRVTDLVKRATFPHLTTHRRITFHVYTARSRARRGTWRTLDDLADLPMSNAQRRVIATVMSAAAAATAATPMRG